MDDLSKLDELKRILPQCLLADQLRIGRRLAQWISDHHRAGAFPPHLDRWLADARHSLEVRYFRQEALPAIRYPDELPITAKKDDIIHAIQHNPVVVIAGETGSGKTTQIPKMCLEAGLGVRAKIGCTQPRRIAALSLSRRVAEELNVKWGAAVGCKIRFSDHTEPDTYIKFMTDGILLAEIQNDPFLSDYEAILIDEAHERSLNIDFLLGLLKNLLAKRRDLKLIITSATIDTEAFSQAFDHAPILQVSGRMYPVDVMYAPPIEEGEEKEDTSYVDAAVEAVEQIFREYYPGDILIFMPSERDILETRDALQQSDLGPINIVPLFGRLSAEDQQRVFSCSNQRKVVIATNIAETSLTVPGIRYVVDTGLARFSRYNPRTRTRRLPIEPISQSSANQRKGRCGRVAEGVCIRLYDEADFQSRPLYTQPEIQRANLAEVILRMKAFRMGDIETFPFINPPAPSAIQGGYQLLHELGAITMEKELLPLGRDLAQLPIDPTIGRMIMQAHHENALTETLIIASGLSIQDPRERPADRQDTASAAHRKFHHPKSDFLTLLNIWNAYHDTFESLRTQSQLRKFCKTHFLSYPRMREWRDIHDQLREALDEMGGFNFNAEPASYASIHRAILTGLWSYVGLKKEKNIYQLGGNRTAMVYPGSGIFERNEKKTAPANKADTPQKSSSNQPRWIIAGELVETSRLFLRTIAEIDPAWILELAPHLYKRSFHEPHWDERQGRVLAREKVTLSGLEILDCVISYDKVNPESAKEIFIRAALVGEGLGAYYMRRALSQAQRIPQHAHSQQVSARKSGDTRKQAPDMAEELEQNSPELDPSDIAWDKLPASARFLRHNHQLRHKIEIWQTGLSQRVVPELDETFYQAYNKRLENLSSVAELERLLRETRAANPDFLCLREEDILGDFVKDFNHAAFPDALPLGDQMASVVYAYAPGMEKDGYTIRLPFTLAQMVEPSLLDWAVPGLREQQILHLLQALPKNLRRPLMPIPPKAREMAGEIVPSGGSFVEALSQYILDHFGVTIPGDAWDISLLPSHLRPRYEILDKDHKSVAVGRDLPAMRDQLKQKEKPAAPDASAENKAWSKAVQQWERYGITTWNFGVIPEQVVVCEVAGFPLHAFPALQIEEGEINLRLFRKREEAETAHRAGLIRLLELQVLRELAWMEKDLRALSKVRNLYVIIGPVEELEAFACENLKRHLFRFPGKIPVTVEEFNAWVEDVRKQIPTLTQTMMQRLGEILKMRHEIQLCKKPHPQMQEDLMRLAPRDFLQRIPYDRLVHLPRYLKAVLVRAERAASNPSKDMEKARRIQPYHQALKQVLAIKSPKREIAAKIYQYFWLLEEYRVSIYAQELGTAEPVSPKKLDSLLQEIKGTNS